MAGIFLPVLQTIKLIKQELSMSQAWTRIESHSKRDLPKPKCASTLMESMVVISHTKMKKMMWSLIWMATHSTTQVIPNSSLKLTWRMPLCLTPQEMLVTTNSQTLAVVSYPRAPNPWVLTWNKVTKSLSPTLIQLTTTWKAKSSRRWRLWPRPRKITWTKR